MLDWELTYILKATGNGQGVIDLEQQLKDSVTRQCTDALHAQ